MMPYYSFKISEFPLKFGQGNVAIDSYYIVRFGPYSKHGTFGQGVSKYKLLLVLHSEDHEELAKRFIEDLINGYRQRLRIFPGFNRVLGTSIKIEPATYKKRDGRYSPDEILESFNQHASSGATFPVIILPRVAKSEYDSIYYKTKATFLSLDLPSQVVTIDLLRDEERYKWSLLPITVQIFAKMGGIPYALGRRPLSEGFTNVKIHITGLGLSHHPLHKKRGVGFITVFDEDGSWNFMNSIALSTDKREDISESIAKLFERTANELLQRTNSREQILIIHYSGKEISSLEEEAIRNAVQTARSLNKFLGVFVLKIRESDIIIGLEDSPHRDRSGSETWYPPVGAVFKIKPSVYLLVTTGYFETRAHNISSNVFRGLPSAKIISRHREMEIYAKEHPTKISLEDIDLLKSVFAMCRLNYASVTNPVSKSPTTIRYAREIAWLTTRLEDHGVKLDKLYNIRYVMWFL